MIDRRSIEPDALFGAPVGSRYFLRFFKKKGEREGAEGALSSEKLKALINSIGKGKKVNITRLAYDGTPDKPVSVKIVDIRNDYFTAKVINVERSIKQSESTSIIYIKGGGGTIDFYFADGDILSVEEDIDQEVIELRNADEVKEILDALDLNEEVIVSYYDEAEGGVINGKGMLKQKNMDTLNFEFEFQSVNNIELSKPKVISLNLNTDKIVDVEVVI